MKPNIDVMSGGRDLRFDSLRGLLLLAMTINHVPSPLRVFSDRWIGVFTSAEGFVFISGLLAGMVYTRRLRKTGPEGLRSAVLRRANMIYAWHACALILALVVVQVIEHTVGYCSWAAPQLFFQNPWLGGLLGLTLLYQPGLFDILPMYCVFVLLLPILLRALEAGRRKWVLALSVLAWAAVQGSSPIDNAPLYPINVGTFNLFAWQLLFVLGVVIGHAQASRPASSRMRFNPLLFAAAGSLAFYCWGIQHWQWRPPCSDDLFGISLNKPSLGLLRLADFGAVAYIVAWAASRAPALFTWRPLAFLGQHSLAVVAAQSLIVMLVLQFPLLFANQFRIWLVTVVCVACLFAAAALHRRLTRKVAEPLIVSRKPGAPPLSRTHDVRVV